MGDANAGVYVGVAVLGVIAVVVICLVVACCWYTSKRGSGRNSATVVEQVRSDTRSIKSKANQLKREQSTGWCSCCCVSTNSETDTGELEPPAGVHVLYSEGSAVTVSWKRPDKLPSYYSAVRVQVFKRLSEEGSDSWTKVGTVKQSDLQYRMRHKDPDISCHIGVATKYKSRKSKIVERELIYTPAEPPGIPVDFKAYEQPDKCVLVTWRPPVKAGRYGITVYDLMVKDGPSSTWSSLARVKPNPTLVSYTVKMKANWSKRPMFRVAAENIRGKGPYTESDQALLKGHVQLQPKLEGNLQYSNVTHNSVTLSWRAPHSGAVNEYIVERREVADGRPWKRTGTSRTTSFIAKKLPNSTEMIFRVIATNEAGFSEPLIGGKFNTRGVADGTIDKPVEARHNAARSEMKPGNKPVHTSRQNNVDHTSVTEPSMRRESLGYEKQKRLQALNKKRSIQQEQEKPLETTANKRPDDSNVLDISTDTLDTDETDNSVLTLRDMTVNVRGVARRKLEIEPVQTALPESVGNSEYLFQIESPEKHFTKEPTEVCKTGTNDTHLPKQNDNKAAKPNDSHITSPKDTRSTKLNEPSLTGSDETPMIETSVENVKELKRTEDDLTGPQTVTPVGQSQTRREEQVLSGELQQPSNTRYRHTSYLELE